MAPNEDRPRPDAAARAENDRLDSWKEIAAFLQRDVRTVQRWEKQAHLPVHRHPEGRLRTAYAYRSELEAWWRLQRDSLESADRIQPAEPAEQRTEAATSGEAAPELARPGAWSNRPGWPGRRAMAALLLIGVLSAALTAVLVRKRDPPPEVSTSFRPVEILVVPIDDRAGNPALAETLQEVVRVKTAGQSSLQVVEPARISRALRLMRRDPSSRLDDPVGREAALRDGSIAYVVTGRVYMLGSRYFADLRAIEPVDGHVRASVEWQGATPEDLIARGRPLAAELAERLAADVSTHRRPAASLEPVTSSSLRAVRLYSAATQAGRRRQWGAAESLARRALSEDPDFAAAHAWAGWAMRQRGRSAGDTLPVLRHALGLTSGLTERETHLVAGIFHTVQGDLSAAIAELQALLRLHPRDRDGLDLLVHAFSRVGQVNSALETAVARADHYPDDFDAVVGAAQALTLADPFGEEATAYVRRAHALVTPKTSRRSPSAHAWLVGWPVFQEWLNGSDRALASANAIREGLLTRRGRDRDRVAERLGFAYWALGRLAEADQAFASSPSPARELNLAMLALARGDEAAARQSLLQIRDQSGLRPSLFARAGLTREAERGLELARSSDHAEGIAAVVRGLVESRNGRVAQAERSLSQGLDLLRWSGEPELFFAIEELVRLAQLHGDDGRVTTLLEKAAAERAHTYGLSQWTGGYWAKLNADLLALRQRTDLPPVASGPLR